MELVIALLTRDSLPDNRELRRLNKQMGSLPLANILLRELPPLRSKIRSKTAVTLRMPYTRAANTRISRHNKLHASWQLARESHYPRK